VSYGVSSHREFESEHLIVFCPCFEDINKLEISGFGFSLSTVDSFLSIIRAEKCFFPTMTKYPCLQFCGKMYLNGF